MLSMYTAGHLFKDSISLIVNFNSLKNELALSYLIKGYSCKYKKWP